MSQTNELRDKIRKVEMSLQFFDSDKLRDYYHQRIAHDKKELAKLQNELRIEIERGRMEV